MKKDKSTLVSLICVLLLGGVLAILAFTAPMLTKAFIESFNRPAAVFYPVVTTFYCILPFAAGVIVCLIKLLLNIMGGEVFTKLNVTLIRSISILMFIATLIFAVAGYFYMPFYLLAVCAAFITLIVRVVKNCFTAAVVLKDENDMTI